MLRFQTALATFGFALLLPAAQAQISLADRADGALTLIGGWDFNGVGTATTASTLVARYNQQYTPYFASASNGNGNAALQSKLYLTSASGAGATFTSARAFDVTNAPVYDLLSTDGLTVSNNSLGDQTTAPRSLLLSTASVLNNARAVFELDTLTAFDRFESISVAYSARNQGSAAAAISWSYSIDGGFTFTPISGTTASLSAGQASFSVYTADFTGLAAIEGRENILIGLEYSETAAGASVFLDNVAIYGTAAPLATPPSITGLADLAVVLGAPATFTASVTDAGASPVYQWQRSPESAESWTAIPGASTATLAFAAVAESDFARYRLVVTNPTNNTSATSSVVRLIQGITPAITTEGQPVAVAVNPGQDASFTVVATGSDPITYQWLFDGTPLTASPSVLGVDGPVLTLLAVDAARAGAYTVVVANSFGSVVSADAVLSVVSGDVVPSIQAAPEPVVALEGGTARFVVLASGTPEPTYQWYRDDVALSDGPGIAGATSAELNLSDLTTARAGAYTVRVANSAGEVRSTAVSLTIEFAPRIATDGQPAALTVTSGGVATFTVAASGSPAPTYQWRRGSTALSGRVSATLTLDPVTVADAGDYTVVVTNARGSVTSTVARLTVVSAPTISTPPAPVSAFLGDNVTFRVTATGTPAPTYQWTKDGTAIPGATTATLNLLGVTAADAGAYRVTVTNSAGSVVSSPAALSVGARLFRPVGNAVHAVAPGSRMLLPTSITGTGLRFQWYRDGRAIPGATANTLDIASASASDSGSYALRVYGANGRLLVNHIVGRVVVSRAATFRVLLRDTSSAEAVGLVAINVAANLTFTGSWQAENGRTYAVRGRLIESVDGAETVVSVPYATADVRSLRLAYRYTDLRLAVAIERANATDASGAGHARVPAATWNGRYALTLSDNATSASFTADIATSGVMALKGRLADRTVITASLPGGAGRDYAVWSRLYSGRGYLGGGLRLVPEGASYIAGPTTGGGDFTWFKPAAGANPAIDRVLTPALASRP